MATDTEFCDAVVLGGGPAGSTAAHLLAQAGRRVILLERETFPRFKIGESLLPCSVPLFRRLGVLDEMHARFQYKPGAFFTEEGREGCRKVVFADGLTRGYPSAFHVKRAEFDEMLASAAARAGAEVRFGWRAAEFLRDGDAVSGVRAEGPGGRAVEIRSRVVIDATGRAALGARASGTLRPERHLRRAAIYAHFENVPRPPEETEGDIRMVTFDQGWWWLIPFSDRTWSIGCVTSRIPEGATLEERLDSLISSVPTIAGRLREARRISPVRTESDYSYTVSRIIGDGYVAVGDAAGFLDPIFSSGVFLAMATAERAADELAGVLAQSGGIVPERRLRRYERFARQGLSNFRRFVLGFYNPGFREIFYEDPPVRALYGAVTSVLAGGVFQPGPRLRFWTRIFLFFARYRMKNKQSMEVTA